MRFTRERGRESGRFLFYINVFGTVLLGIFFIYALVHAHDLEQPEKKEKSISKVVKEKSEEASNLDRIAQTLAKQGAVVDLEVEKGVIRFPQRILFDFDSAILSKEGKEILQQHLPLYLRVLMEESYCDEVAALVIEGHTDDKGSYAYNMKLSQERANAVFQYLYSEQFPPFDGKGCSQLPVLVQGAGPSIPVYTEEKYDAAQSRRVEILFQLKKEVDE